MLQQTGSKEEVGVRRPCMWTSLMVLGAALAGEVCQPAVAATLCVNPGGSSGCFSTIGAAVAAASIHDHINVEAGTYKEDVIIGKALSLSGMNPGNTIIAGSCDLGSEHLDDSAGLGETVGPRRQAAWFGRQANHGTHEMVGGYAHFDLFGRHVGSPAGELIQAQLGFEGAQIGLDSPALAVELHDLSAGRRQGREQCQQKGFRAVVRPHLAHDQTATHAGIWRQVRMTSAIVPAGFPTPPAGPSCLGGLPRPSAARAPRSNATKRDDRLAGRHRPQKTRQSCNPRSPSRHWARGRWPFPGVAARSPHRRRSWAPHSGRRASPVHKSWATSMRATGQCPAPCWLEPRGKRLVNEGLWAMRSEVPSRTKARVV
jgi:hypothetical protein